MKFDWQSTADRAMRIIYSDTFFFEDRAQLSYGWSWWPRQCYRTSRWVWGPAVRAEAVWTGPGEPIIERRWLHRDEGLIMMLKRNANGTV